MPQRNQLVEIGFAPDAKGGRAMINKANIPKDMRYQLFCECFKTATTLDNLRVETIRGVMKTRYEHFGKEISSFVKNLGEWGEARTVTIVKYGKLNSRGATCIFMVYAEDHSGDVF